MTGDGSSPAECLFFSFRGLFSSFHTIRPGKTELFSPLRRPKGRTEQTAEADI